MASISRKDLLILRVISISLVLAVCTSCTPVAYILSTPTAAASATAVQVAATPTSTPEPTIPPTPEPLRISGGSLEIWDGTAFQPAGLEAASLATDENGWVTAFSESGEPVAVATCYE